MKRRIPADAPDIGGFQGFPGEAERRRRAKPSAASRQQKPCSAACSVARKKIRRRTDSESMSSTDAANSKLVESDAGACGG